jgi:hypothetical protein
VPDSDLRSRPCLIILETDMHDMRQAVEDIVLKWPGVAKNMMFWLSWLYRWKNLLCDESDRGNYPDPALTRFSRNPYVLFWFTTYGNYHAKPAFSSQYTV